MVVRKMNTASIHRIVAVKCGMFICNLKAYNLSLNAKLACNLYFVTDSQPKLLTILSTFEENETWKHNQLL
jgi:hypothetical protein